MADDALMKAIREAEQLCLGKHTSYAFDDDPKRLVFTLSRYKFVSKMFTGLDHVLEVGCGDCFGSTIVAQAVNKLVTMDIDSYSVGEGRADNRWLRDKTESIVFDLISGPFGDEPFDAVYSLDVLEHIPDDKEDAFLGNIVKSCKPSAPLIIGTPNKTSSPYASRLSRLEHINLKTHDSLKKTLFRHYEMIFMFGMNDEVLHTGFHPMCHYLFALAVQPKATRG